MVKNRPTGMTVSVLNNASKTPGGRAPPRPSEERGAENVPPMLLMRPRQMTLLKACVPSEGELANERTTQ